MGYQTVMNVPRVLSYELAKNLHDSIKPIRGRSPEIRPLANRRDADTYWVKMDGDDVVFMLYKSPVITYKPDGGVVLTADQYSTVSTHQFFYRVLGIGAQASRNTSVITLGDKRYTMRGKDTLTLKMMDGNWCVVAGAKTQFAWHLNRQSANIVRARYKEFTTYFKGMVALRTEEFKHHYGNTVYKGVQVSLHELQQAFNTELTDPDTILGDVAHINSTRGSYGYSGVHKGKRLSGVALFMDKIRSDQSEEDKTMNFYRCGLSLLLTNERLYLRGQEDGVWIAKANNLVKNLDIIILKAHTKDVLVCKELPLGSVSKGTYDRWVEED